MKYSWLILLFGFACIKGPPKLTYSIEHLQFDNPGCQEEREACFIANIRYPIFSGLDSIKLLGPERLVGNYIIDVLGMGDVESNVQDIQKALELVEQSLENVKSSLKYGIGWIADVQTFQVYEDDSLLVFGLESMTSFGGAHPNTNRRYYNFNKLTGESYSYDWLVNQPGIKPRAEAFFRKTYGLDDNESFNSNGFLFPNDTFRLPANYGIIRDSLILYYNRYEAAPYSFGPVELIIPLN